MGNLNWFQGFFQVKKNPGLFQGLQEFQDMWPPCSQVFSRIFPRLFRISYFQNSSLWFIVGRGFLTPSMLWRPPNIPYPNFFKFCPTPLSHCVQLSPPLLFFMFCFFDWMGDCATFDMLFHLMILWIYKCRTLVP